MSTQVLFEPFKKQTEFLEAVFSGLFRMILFGGAIRGGKTFVGLGGLLLLAKKYPNSKWVIVRDTLQTLKRTTIPSFNKICPRSFIKSYNQDTQTVTFTNGSQIIFLGENYADDKELNRFKGLECNGFLLEEMNELQKVTFLKCIERAGSHIIPNMPPPLILGTCNPCNNWVKTDIYNLWKEDKLPSKWLYIPSKITDNPHIPEEYKESLKMLPTYQYEVFVNGNWDIQLKTGGEYWKCFDLDKHVKTCVYDKDLPLHISFDENVNPYLPCGVFQLEGNELRMIKEFANKSPRNTVKDICNDIKREYNGHESGMYIYGDATSKKQDTKLEKGYNFFTLVIDYLKDFNPIQRIPSANPSVVMRGNFINTVFEKNIFDMNIYFDSSCILTINDLTYCKEAPDGTIHKEMETDPQTKVRYQKVGHFSDLFAYIVCEAFKQNYLTYSRGNVENNAIFGLRTDNSY
jgi:hypothetical protein